MVRSEAGGVDNCEDAMSTWLSEKEYLQSGAESAGVTINVAFLSEIKEDFGFRDLLNEVYRRFESEFQTQTPLPAQVATEILGDLLDALKTYFALEEFYGYFGLTTPENPNVSQEAAKLRSGHEKLFLELSAVVELANQLVYREAGPEVTLDYIGDQLERFCINLAEHEQSEMDLMMRLCNEEIGVGD